MGDFKFGLIVVVALVLLVAIVFDGAGPAPHPRHLRQAGRGPPHVRRLSRTYIPLKVNQSGVIPIIFANSLLYIPVLIANFSPGPASGPGSNNQITPTSLFYVLGYGLLILVFTFFYVYVTFDPHQQADIIRKQGGFIPGIRPGPPTEKLPGPDPEPDHVPGALLPGHRGGAPVAAHGAVAPQGYPFFGTTLLIAIGVSLETMRQIDSQLMMRNYEGFLK